VKINTLFIKVFVFVSHNKRIKNYKVMCPNRLLKMGEDDERVAKRVRTYWDADPIHMCADGYRHLARALLDKVAVVAKPAAENKQLQQHVHSSKKTNAGRPSWTVDAVARRSDTDQYFRGGRGQYHPWRGG
jgi:hypothetical protein